MTKTKVENDLRNTTKTNTKKLNKYKKKFKRGRNETHRFLTTVKNQNKYSIRDK